ncbi:MAG: hypothetical protein OEN01_06475, partial [Candidatus Krumholzibacteria bacterium]|nr:hypothetical protein [Candidatus Krumholzibacteria bacterium]
RQEPIGGGLDIRIHPTQGWDTPPAHIILIDAQKRKTGVDPGTGAKLTAIPNSSYEAESIGDAETGAPGPETRIIYVRNAMAGNYTLQVIGTKSAPYHLEVRGLDRDLRPSSQQFLDVRIDAGDRHRYVIDYSTKKGSQVEVTRLR